MEFPIIACARRGSLGPFRVGWSIDAERNRVNDLDIDTHSRFKRPQLLQPFPQLQCRWSQLHEPFQRRAAIGIKADVVIKRTGPVGAVARVK